MMNPFLLARLKPAVEARRALERSKLLGRYWIIAALVFLAVVVIGVATHSWSLGLTLLLLIGIVVGSFLVRGLANRRVPGPEEIARDIERENPQLNALLLTAKDQQPGPDGTLTYLQEKVLTDALQQSSGGNWAETYSGEPFRKAKVLHGVALLAALALFLGALFPSLHTKRLDEMAAMAESAPKPEVPGLTEEENAFIDGDVAVVPGDVEVEKGSRLVIEATFAADLPVEAELILIHDGQPEQRMPMKQSLGDPMFGIVVSRIEEPFRYQIAYRDQTTREFTVGVYVLPEMERTDATVTPPEYTKQNPKEHKDVRKVSAVEGSRIQFDLQFNKPLVEARLVDPEGERDPLAVTLDPADPARGSVDFLPEDSGKWRLELVDPEGREPARSQTLAVTIKKNLPPDIKLAFPGNDKAVSPLEEMAVEARIWDDFEVVGYGATYTFAGEEHELELTALAPSATTDEKKKKHESTHKALFDLEALDAETGQLLSYHLWAEDVGPDGERRRVLSDMFFASVRHFEEIMREGAGPPPGEGEETAELLEQQKEIIIATWNLSRKSRATDEKEVSAALSEDILVVKQSQQECIELVNGAIAKVEDAELKEHLQSSIEYMEYAIRILGEASETAPAKERLVGAVAEEQTAYEFLLKAQGREFEVSRQQKSAGKGAGQPNENSLMELEFKEEEDRYEEEKTPAEPDAQQAENLQVLNRLKELARREDMLAEKIQELQLALEEAKTQEEKDQIEEELKRLQEQQEELLRDLDELVERMDSEENRADMAEEREQLEKTRDAVQEATEQLKNGETDQAANSARKAAEELEELRDEFQEKAAGQFARKMEEMRERAKELKERQAEIEQAAQQLASEEGGDESDDPFGDPNDPSNKSATRELQEKLAEQGDAVSELLDEMRDVSEESELAEPILSDKLYEGVREAKAQQLEKLLEVTRRSAPFVEPEELESPIAKAGESIEDLTDAVEAAASSILGDEEEALKYARSQLDKLIDDLKEGIPEEALQREFEQPGQPGGPQEETEPTSTERGLDGETMDVSSERTAEQSPAGEEVQTPREQQGEGTEPGEKGEGEGQEPGTQPGQGTPESEESEQGQPGGEGQQSDQGGQLGEGEQPGQGQKPGQEPSEGEQPGQGQQPGGPEGVQPGEQGEDGKGKGKGKAKGQGPGEGEPSAGQRQGQSPPSPSRSSGGGGSTGGSQNADNTGTEGEDQPRPFFLDDPNLQRSGEGTLYGESEGYVQWSDSLRNVEESLQDQELRSEAARILDKAREIRSDYRRNDASPQWAVVLTDVLGPLTSLRHEVSEELARRSGEDPLAPIDKESVPEGYEDLVRKYYESLGEGRRKSPAE